MGVSEQLPTVQQRPPRALQLRLPACTRVAKASACLPATAVRPSGLRSVLPSMGLAPFFGTAKYTNACTGQKHTTCQHVSPLCPGHSSANNSWPINTSAQPAAGLAFIPASLAATQRESRAWEAGLDEVPVNRSYLCVLAQAPCIQPRLQHAILDKHQICRHGGWRSLGPYMHSGGVLHMQCMCCVTLAGNSSSAVFVAVGQQ